MRLVLPALLSIALLSPACSGSDPAPGGPTLVIQPDDGRAPILEVIKSATRSIRLTIYAITDLQTVAQTPAAPADSVVRALMDKAAAGVSVRVIVDQAQAQTQAPAGSHAAEIQQTIAALRAAGAEVRTSSAAFCYTHQKTFLIDGPTAADPTAPGTAVIMSLNLMPSYFGTSRDYAVITREPGVVQEISRVFEADFALETPPTGQGCQFAHTAGRTAPPPAAADTPALAEAALLWSPVNSKSKLQALIASTRRSLVLTTEVMTDPDMACALQAVAQSEARPRVRILLSTDTGTTGAAVNHLLGLKLWNLELRVMPGLPDRPDLTVPQTPLYMHGKQVIVDGAQAFLGSENLTNTSLLQNRELGYLFTDPAMIARLLAIFEADFTSVGASLPAAPCTGSGCGSAFTCPAAP